ncbi:putative inorganic phosphate cotransporter [Schistocerca americana]|uniref:putative inorganic phosphate cotransporter n=1 Tax=Schistocerca americana TaxID=7009 RepID=UPI001F50162A|nr:putative inorganic phosphate cotransporter [Schistocerca americana]
MATTEQQPELSTHNAPALGVRHLMSALLCVTHVLAFSMRGDMSVGVVVMANNTGANPNIKDYGWTPSQTSTILSSFFWGYAVMLSPAGWLADRFGAKNFLSGSLFFSGIVTTLTEVVADAGGIVFVCASRVVLGLCQGFIFPCTHSLLAKWIPPKENAVLGTIVYSGGQMGTVIATVVSGVLAQSAAGWPSIFYTFGGLAIVWGVLVFFFGADSPAKHRYMSPQELSYIEESVKCVSQDDKKLPTPWVSLFTSIPFIALALTHMAQNWGSYTLLTEIPTYFSNVLKLNITANGIVSALPYIVAWAVSLVASWIVNFVQRRQMLSTGALRKVINTFGHWCPAAALLALSVIKVENPAASVALLTVAVGCNGVTIMGFQLNHIDLARNFSGVMMGITTGIATLMSIAAPLYVGAVVKENTLGEWRIVFLTAAGFFFVGNLIFILFASGEVQPWNDPNYSRKKKTDYGATSVKEAA